MVWPGDAFHEIDVSSRLFLGEALFETIKIVLGKPVDVESHWVRLKNAAQLCQIPFDVSLDEWHEFILNVLDFYKISHGGLKLILCSGPAARGLCSVSLTSLLISVPIEILPVQKTVSLCLSPWSRDEANPLYKIKSINYLEFIIGQRQAQKRGYDDMLYQNHRGHILETSVANIFLILDQQVFTPPLGDGILAGLMREKVIQTLQRKKIPCFEQSITHEMLWGAQDAFITNTLIGTCPIGKINDHEYLQQTHLLLKIQKIFS